MYFALYVSLEPAEDVEYVVVNRMCFYAIVYKHFSRKKTPISYMSMSHYCTFMDDNDHFRTTLTLSPAPKKSDRLFSATIYTAATYTGGHFPL